jgi:hypothetical protein
MMMNPTAFEKPRSTLKGGRVIPKKLSSLVSSVSTFLKEFIGAVKSLMG